ncbi:hypothetical protein Tco_0811831 [Tanacetum coccineum]
MASEHDCLEPELQRFNYHNSSANSMNTAIKEDLDNLFGPMFEDYFEKASSDTTINSAAQPTQVHEESSSTSSIIVDTHEAPPVVTTSDEQTSPISLTVADEFNQEDTADFDEPSNVQNFHQVQPSTHIWTKDHPLDQVIGDPSKPVMTRQRLHTDSEVCMYALTVSTIEPKNIKEAMADHSTPTDQTTYRRMIGGLMYLTVSRPDIAFATFVCAQYQARPTVKHLKEVKQIFRYLRQSYNMGLWYPKDSKFELIAYSDADHEGCKDDCKSTSGGLQFLGGKLVSWISKKQDYTAMSFAEAEYVSLSACCAQVIWMRTQLLNYGYKYNRIPMYCDSKSAIAISCNPVQHSKMKHIDIRYHFIKEHVEKGTVEIYFVGTEYQLADLFTKALPKERFEYLVHRIGMRCMTPTQLESLTKLSS